MGLCMALAAALALLAGCSGGDTADLQQRVKDLEAENQSLKQQVEKLSGEFRPLQARVDKLDEGQRLMEKTLVQARKDLEARVTDVVQQELGGRGRRLVHNVPAAPAPRPVRFEEQPYLGFDGQNVEPDVAKLLKLKSTTGILVTDVREGAPAALAGVKKNDVITSFDGADTKSFDDLKKALAGKKPGEVVAIGVLRGDEKLEQKVTIGMRRVPVED